jgi:hypothetical protein
MLAQMGVEMGWWVHRASFIFLAALVALAAVVAAFHHHYHKNNEHHYQQTQPIQKQTPESSPSS